MSRDIFVQDIPSSIADARDIPDGWMPEPMRSFAFHVRAAGWGADYVVADIFQELDLRAFDPDNDSCLFRDPGTERERGT